MICQILFCLSIFDSDIQFCNLNLKSGCQKLIHCCSIFFKRRIIHSNMALHTDSTANFCFFSFINVIDEFYNFIRNIIFIVIIIEQRNIFLQTVLFQLIISYFVSLFHIGWFQAHVTINIHPGSSCRIICAVRILIRNVPAINKGACLTGQTLFLIHDMFHYRTDIKFKSFVHHFFRDISATAAISFLEETR